MDDDDYLTRLIAHRCGEEVAASVVPARIFVDVLEVMNALGERVAAFERLMDADHPPRAA
jgi:hypothetical protein